MFTKQHYIEIAKVIKGCKVITDGQETYDSKIIRKEIVCGLSDFFAKDNPNFNREKFFRFVFPD